MKRIYIFFEDEEFEELKRVKKKLSWHDFIMSIIKMEYKLNENNDVQMKLENEISMNLTEAAEIIRGLEPEYDFTGIPTAEIVEYATKLREDHK